MMLPSCVQCGAARAQRVCGSCTFAAYCSDRCAQLDWPIHYVAEPHARVRVARLNMVWREPDGGGELWLGGISALNKLDAHQISAVLTVIQRDERNDADWLAQRLGPERTTSERWLWLSHHDAPEEDMSGDFGKATDFISGHLRAGRNVLVHCHAGMSRSATMVSAYLLHYHPAKFPSVASAIEWLRERRSIVDPNPGFVKQLEGWK